MRVAWALLAAVAATVDDVIGEARVTVPRGGQLLWLLSRWWMLAVIGGLLIGLLLWRSADGEPPTSDVSPRRRAARRGRTTGRGAFGVGLPRGHDRRHGCDSLLALVVRRLAGPDLGDDDDRQVRNLVQVRH